MDRTNIARRWRMGEVPSTVHFATARNENTPYQLPGIKVGTDLTAIFKLKETSGAIHCFPASSISSEPFLTPRAQTTKTRDQLSPGQRLKSLMRIRPGKSRQPGDSTQPDLSSSVTQDWHRYRSESGVRKQRAISTTIRESSPSYASASNNTPCC